jgi:glycosyltransferase involved in cell wall biosynthesis
VLSALLVDLTPGGGSHGQRGIGRYVRGLEACIHALPAPLQDRVWAFEATQSGRPTMRRSVAPSPSIRDRLPTWVDQGRLRRAARIVGAGVVHATDPHRPWTRGIPTKIVTAYDLIPLRDPEILASLRIDDRWVYRRYLDQLRTADRVVAISRTTATDVAERLGVPMDRIDVVYPVVDAPPLDRHPSDEPTYIVVGAVDAHKRAGLAVEAIARLRTRRPTARLRFIGPASDEQRRTVLDLAARSGVIEAVSVDGRIPDDELELAYESATALLSTSRIEGFGLPPVEALARGVPVVAVNTDAARETLGDAALIVDADADAIAEALLDPKLPRSSEVADIRRRFSVQSAAQALAVVYGRVLR